MAQPPAATEQQGLFHDVLQSLTTVSLLTAALELELQEQIGDRLPADTTRRMGLLRQEIGALQDLVRSVLDRDPVALVEEIALDEVVGAACAVFSETQRTDVIITTKRALVTANRADLRRLVANVLQNAFAAAGDGGTVAVDVRAVGDRAVLHVSDSGPGFGNLRRQGYRLGLPVVRSIIAQLGGELRLGAAPAGGAAVTVTLPRTTRDAALAQRHDGRLLDLVADGS